jgi:carbamoyl-phosphate synthase small subunit
MTRISTNAVLLLEDGTVFHGKSCGAVGVTTGEIAFNTAMTGYQEVFSDPSYFGQVLIMATAHVGNYGVHAAENESDKCQVSGVIIKRFSDTASRVGGAGTLQDYLERDNVVGICDIDTRALVRHIRKTGAMNCLISTEGQDLEVLRERLRNVPSMAGLELASKVSTREVYHFGNPSSSLRIAVLDLGVKRSILQCLSERGAYLNVYPIGTTAVELLRTAPDGVMFTNGPGDPEVMHETIATVERVIESGVPCFGICLGHQIIALSQGLKTVKMFNGHRGINHPVKNLLTGKSEITSQNHGFVVSKESLENRRDVEVTHVHLNDHTIAGIRLTSKPVFSVQYHPEAGAGPHDSRYLFDQFISTIHASKNVGAITH